MSASFGGLSVPAELYAIACILVAVFMMLLCIWLELVLARLRSRSR